MNYAYKLIPNQTNYVTLIAWVWVTANEMNLCRQQTNDVRESELV